MVKACLGGGGRGLDEVLGAKAWAICSPQGSAAASVMREVGTLSLHLQFCLWVLVLF